MAPKNVLQSWLIKLVVAVACLLLALLGLNILTVPEPFLATMLAVSLLLVLPGYLLSRLIWGQHHPLLDQLALAFGLSVGLWSIAAALMLWLHGNLAVMIWIVLSITLLLAASTLLRSQPNRSNRAQLGVDAPTTTDGQAAISREWPRLVYWVAFVVSLVLVLVIFANTAIPIRQSDRVTYQAFLRHFLDAEQFLTRGFRISSTYIGSARELIQTWVVLLALVIKLAQIDMLDAYVYYLPPLLILASFFALYALAKELFGSQIMALNACLVQAVYYLSDIPFYEGIGRSIFLRIIEDKFLIRFVLLPISLWLTLRYLKKGDKGVLVSLVFTMIPLGLIHPMGLPLYGISLGSFLVVTLLFGSRQEKKEKLVRVIPVIIAMLVMVLVPLGQRQQMISSVVGGQFFGKVAETLNVFRARRLLMLTEEANLYIASPDFIAHPLVILAIVLTPLLLKYLRTRVSAQFLFANMAGTLLLCYTPLITPLLGKVITPWMIWRVLWLLPVTLVISFFLSEAMQRLTGRFRQISPQLVQLTPLGVILAGALLLGGEIDNGIKYLESQKNRPGLTTEERTLFTYLRENGTPDSVILTPSTSLSNEIPGLVGHSYGITFRTVPPLLESAHEDRARFYEATVVTKAHLDILRQYQIMYVILKAKTELNYQFAQLSSMFKPLYANQSYLLYQWQPELATGVETYIIQGNTYLLKDDTAAAEMAYRQALRQQPEHSLAAMGLGNLYWAEGRVEEALAAYQQALTASPADVQLHFRLAQIYEAQGETKKALTQYQQIIELEPDNAKAYNCLRRLYRKDSELYIMKSGLDEAIALMRKISSRRPEIIWPHLELGYLYAEQGKLEEAITEYQKAIELKPDSADAYIQLGDLYKSRGRIGEAIALYRDAARRNTGVAWPHIRLGEVYLEEVGQDAKAAITEFQTAIRWEPDNAQAYDYLGLAYRLDGQLEEAIEVYEKAARLNPYRAWPYLGLGDLYMDEGDVEKAATEYQRAIALEPYVVYGYERLGQAYESQGDIEAALAQYLEAADVTLGPETGMQPYLEKAETYISEGDLKAAESVIETARGVMPYDPHILSLAIGLDLALMQRYKAQGKVSEARAKAWEVLAMDSKRELALETLIYYDFIDNLDQAQIDAPREPFEHVKVTRFVMPNGDQRPVLFMHPEARVFYQLAMPSEPSVLQFSPAMSPETWDWGGNGATFEIYLDEGSGAKLLFSKHISNDAEDRRWHDEEIDLSPYAGQEIDLTFVTGPGPGADFTGDAAGWATPRIMLK